jgi:hypothetical protein
MAFSKKTVLRIDDLSGDSFILMEAPTASTEYAQGVVLIDEDGNPQGLTSSPLSVKIDAGALTQFHSGDDNVTNFVCDSSSGSLYDIRVVLDPSVSVARYLMLFDANAAPSSPLLTPQSTGGLIWSMVIPPAGEASESFPLGLAYTAGLTACISSTHDDYTVVASAEGIIFGQRI